MGEKGAKPSKEKPELCTDCYEAECKSKAKENQMRQMQKDLRGY